MRLTIVVTILLLLVSACTPTPTPTPTPTEAPAEPCALVAEEEVTVYDRPSDEASVFGALPAGEGQVVEALTADDWVGFEPGVAQAANVGIFRLRWVYVDDVLLSGDCTAAPVVEGPPPNVCFTMPMETTSVYVEPDAGSEVLETLEVGDYAAVTARGDEWAQVSLAPGNLGLEVDGWVRSETLNLNGSSCADLPAP